jgi:hypothetical protein
LISLRFLISWLALVCLGANSNASEQSFGDGADEFGAPAISVSEGDWGNVNRAEIHDVLVATARELQMFFPERHGDAIRVERSTRAPTVLYQRNAAGEYVVYLTVTGRRWEQYTYEFAHELCHIYGNHHQRPNSALAPHQWFEESLCETASLFVLRRMGLTWHARGFEQRNYAPIFAEYAKLLMNEVQSTRPTDTRAVVCPQRDATLAESVRSQTTTNIVLIICCPFSRRNQRAGNHCPI